MKKRKRTAFRDNFLRNHVPHRKPTSQALDGAGEMCEGVAVIAGYDFQQLVSVVNRPSGVVERLARKVARSSSSGEEITTIRNDLAAHRRQRGGGQLGADTSFR